MFYNFMKSEKCRNSTILPLFAKMSFFFKKKSVQFTFLSGHSVKTIDPSVILHINKICIFVCSIIFLYTKKP